MANAVMPVSPTASDLAEGPLWSEREQALYWHDVTGRKLHRLHAASGEVQSFPLPAMPGSFAFRRGGGMLAAFRNRLALFDVDRQAAVDITGHDIDFGRERFNDGASDPGGRFWVGTFDPSLKGDGGSLYRIDADFSVHRMDTGFAMSNGMAWSPDGKTMYFVDSRPGRVYRYEFEPLTGTIGKRSILIDYEDRPGRPDGCAVDLEGFLWIAEVMEGQVSRYAPDGRHDRSIPLPASKPTSLTFGGRNLSTLYATTMRYGLTDEEREAEPLAGYVLSVEVEVAGLPENIFGG